MSESQASSSPNLPARMVNSLATGVKAVFGQMATKKFWLDMASLAVKQMVNAFLITLGGKLLTYGTSREDPEVRKTANIYGGGGVNTAASAFSGSPVRQDYASQFTRQVDPRSYPVPVQQTPIEKTFPGFGGGR